MSALRMLPLGYEQLTSTIASSAAGLTNIPPGMVVCTLQAEGQNVRYRDDGVAPTATVGMLLEAGAAPFLYTGTVSALKFIAATSGGILNASFYRIAG